MKLTRINIFDTDLPISVCNSFSDVPFYDSSCSPEARVYFADKDEGYFIKISKSGSLRREAMMIDYFASLGLSKSAVSYECGERDILITKKILGEDLTSAAYLSDPVRLAENMGRMLRTLHETDAEYCPIKDRCSEYLANFHEGYKMGRFDPSFIDRRLKISTPDAAYEYALKNSHLLKNEVLLHGDFCLPNVIFRDWSLSGYIDLGAAGIGDRHIDLFWGAWTLNYNLGTDTYRDVFFDSYGRDLVDEEKLLLVSAIEAFG
jgi:kanamycin kinase